MTDQPNQEEINRWQRWFAVQANNLAWDLIEKQGRNSDEDQEMIDLAHTSAYHWSKIGTPVNHARAAVTLAFAYGMAGRGEPALDYAKKALVYFESNPAEDWDIAFAHCGVALAASLLGDTELLARHYDLARGTTNAIQDDEDRKIVNKYLSLIPRPL